MHSGDSSIRVPVDIGIEGAGRATRNGVVSPKQQFVPVERNNLKVGSTVMNAVTLELHVVFALTDNDVTLQTKSGPVTVGWDDVQATAWLLVET